MADQLDHPTTGRRGKRRRRIVLLIGAAAGVVLVIAVVLTPAIASSIAPGMIRDALASSINGRVSVGRVSLSWFGKQTVGPITLTDESGVPAAKVTVEASSGLLSLALGGTGLGAMDLGTVKISGESTIVRHKDGSTNLEELFKRQANAPSGGTGKPGGQSKLPRGLTGQLVIEPFAIRLVDEEGPRTVETAGLTLKATYGNGAAAIQLQAPATLTERGATRPAGSLKVDATVNGLADAAGVLTPDKATVEAVIDATDLSTQVAGILTGLGDKLVQGLGESVRVSAKVNGGLGTGDADIVIASQGLNADLGVHAGPDGLTTSRPGTARVAGGVLRAFSAEFEQSVPNIRIATMPDVALTLNSLRVPRTGDAGVDLTKAAATLTLKSTAMSAVLALADQPERRVDVAPLDMTIDASNPAAAIVKAATAFNLDGVPAGAVLVDLQARDPFAGTMPALSGQAHLKDLSTAAAQPFVASAGLDLPAGIGPKMDVQLTAVQADGGARTDVDVKVRSAALNGSAAMSYGNAVIQLRSPAEFALRSPRTLAAKALESSGVRVSEGGFAKVVVRSLSAPLSGPMLDAISADATLTVGGVSVMPEGIKAEPVSINQVIATFATKPGGVPRLALKASGSHATAPAAEAAAFFAEGEFELAGMFGTKEGSTGKVLTPTRVRPIGSLKINDIPTSLFTWVNEAPDTLRIVRDSVGSSVTMTVDARPGRTASESALTLTIAAPQLNGRAAAEFTDTALAISGAEFRSTVTPQLVSTLLELAGPQLTSRPALAGPAAMTLTLDAMSIPIQGGTLNVAGAGDAAFRIGLEGTTRITNLVIEDEGGKQRDLGAVVLRDMIIKGRAPVGSIAGGDSARPAELTLTGAILGDQDQPVAAINGSASMAFAKSRPVGDLAASWLLAIQDAAKLDTILAQPGIVSGAVGEKLDVKATAAVTFASTGDRAGSLERATVDASIESPRVSTVRPLKILATGDGTATRIALDSAMELKWNADASWLNRYIVAGAKPDPQGLAISGAPVLTVKLFKLNVPLVAGAVSMKPGEFLADAEVTAPELTLTAGASSTKIRNFAGRAAGGREAGVIGFNIRADDLGAGPGPGGKQAMVIQGGVYQVADAEGRPTPERAVLSMTGEVYGAPTAMLDAVSHQGGWLTEALGPMVTLNVQTQGVNKQRGNIVLIASSPRAEAEIKGVISAGTFVAEGEPKIVLHRITPEFGKMLVNGLPLIGTFEKRAEDGPTVVSASALSIPMDGKVENFSGELRLDIGTARFETSKVFGAVLKAINQRDTGMIGRRVEPLTLSVKNGIITYPRWKLPLGEFSVDTRGTVDLANRKLEFVTYIPFGALSDEAAGRLNTGLGRLLGGAVPLIEQATMIPFRTTGSFDEAKTEVDLELYAKEAGRTLLRPDLLIKEGLQDLFKPKGK